MSSTVQYPRRRDEMAIAAAPYLHPKMSAVEPNPEKPSGAEQHGIRVVFVRPRPEPDDESDDGNVFPINRSQRNSRHERVMRRQAPMPPGIRGKEDVRQSKRNAQHSNGAATTTTAARVRRSPKTRHRQSRRGRRRHRSLLEHARQSGCKSKVDYPMSPSGYRPDLLVYLPRQMQSRCLASAVHPFLSTRSRTTVGIHMALVAVLCSACSHIGFRTGGRAASRAHLLSLPSPTTF